MRKWVVQTPKMVLKRSDWLSTPPETGVNTGYLTPPGSGVNTRCVDSVLTLDRTHPAHSHVDVRAERRRPAAALKCGLGLRRVQENVALSTSASTKRWYVH